MKSANTVRLQAGIRYIESKTVDQRSTGMFRLSSYAGWTKPENYPKLLVLATLDKTKTSFKLKNRFWDIDGRVAQVLAAKWIAGPEHIVPHASDLHDRMLAATTTDARTFDRLKAEVKAANEASSLPIRLDLPGGQATGQARLYLSLRSKDLHQLPDAPDAVQAHLESYLVGTRLRMRKDYSDIGGPRGWFSERMIEWEHASGLYDSDKQARRKGELHITFPDGHKSTVHDFKDGREMYWTGHAFELCLGECLDMETTRSHTPGVDLGDGRLRRWTDLLPKGQLRPQQAEDHLHAEGLEKVDLLEALLELHGGTLARDHWSSGSTVTRAGLAELHARMGVAPVRRLSKESLIRSLLDHVGQEFEGRLDIVHPGSTVTAYALLKVLRGVLAAS